MLYFIHGILAKWRQMLGEEMLIMKLDGKKHTLLIHMKNYYEKIEHL